MEHPDNISKLTEIIRAEAIRLGFLECGFSKVRELSEVKPTYIKWIASGYQASMSYMERNTEKRLNPGLLVEKSKTVISLLYNYNTPDQFADAPYKISRYAYGVDYHEVVKNKLKQLDSFIRKHADNVVQRCFVDSAPILERTWAHQSGLGWIGKNTCLISRKHGSFIFIAEIITSIELAYNEPINDYCGTCHKCIDACPTQAIKPDRLIDSNKCISYQTIENRGAIPTSMKGKFNRYIVGCDICQSVCPWNKKAHFHNEPLFNLKDEIRNLTSEEWENMNEDSFRRIFRNSAIERAKFDGVKRNISFLRGDLYHLPI